MNIRRTVWLRVVSSGVSPLVVGFVKPTIILPASILTNLSSQELEAILAHELAHIRRNDYLVNLFQAMIETMLFYHPAIWLVSRQIRIEREYCADDLAIKVCAGRDVYARSLLSLAEFSQTTRSPAVAANGGRLSDRIRRVLQPGESQTEVRSFTLNRQSFLAGIISVTCVGIALIASAQDRSHEEFETDKNSKSHSTAADSFNETTPREQTEPTETSGAKKRAQKAATVNPVELSNEPEQQVTALLTIARAKYEAKDHTAASEMLRLAVESALQISDMEPGPGGIPGSWVQSGKMMEACIATAFIEGPDSALKRTERITAPHLRTIVLCHVADLQTDAGDRDAANASIARALKSAKSVDVIPEKLVWMFLNNRAHQVMSFQAVTTSYTKSGDYIAALEVVDKLLELDRDSYDCWPALQEMLTIQIVNESEMGISTVKEYMEQLDKEDAILSLVLAEAQIESARRILERGDIERAYDIVQKLFTAEYIEEIKYQLDSMMVHIGIERMKREQPKESWPQREDYQLEVSQLKLNSLHARWLARKQKTGQATEMLTEVVDSVSDLDGSEGEKAQTLTFVAQTHAVLGNYERAFKTVEMLNPKVAAYVNSHDMDFYDLPYQPIIGRNTALALIAREQLKAGKIDKSIETVNKVTLERMENGALKGWYPEKVKATALAEIAATLCENGETAKAGSLAESAETEVIKTAIMTAIASKAR